jgi:hypothetical protein
VDILEPAGELMEVWNYEANILFVIHLTTLGCTQAISSSVKVYSELERMRKEAFLA